MANVPKPEDTELPVAAAEAKKAEQGITARRGDDRELVRRAQHGEKEAFEVLVAKHQGRVFAVAGGILRNREDVEDIAQQVFLKAYFSLKRFDQRSAFQHLAVQDYGERMLGPVAEEESKAAGFRIGIE